MKDIEKEMLEMGWKKDSAGNFVSELSESKSAELDDVMNEYKKFLENKVLARDAWEAAKKHYKGEK